MKKKQEEESKRSEEGQSQIGREAIAYSDGSMHKSDEKHTLFGRNWLLKLQIILHVTPVRMTFIVYSDGAVQIRMER